MPRDKRRSILVLGAGGFTAGLDDAFNNYTFIDIEKTLKDVSEQKFLNEKLTLNKVFIVQDASQFLKNTPMSYDLIILDVYSNSYQVPEDFITAEFMRRIKERVAKNGIIIMNVICSPNFADRYTQVFDNTFHAVFTSNTQRQVVGPSNPWMENTAVNVMYIYYNRESTDRIYTINKTPVIYDRK
jgi:spermidine synthase